QFVGSAPADRVEHGLDLGMSATLRDLRQVRDVPLQLEQAAPSERRQRLDRRLRGQQLHQVVDALDADTAPEPREHALPEAAVEVLQLLERVAPVEQCTSERL